MKNYGAKTLSYDEEKNLALKIQKGLKALEKVNNCTDANELKSLNSIIEEGNLARERLISYNLKFVSYVIKEYLGKGLEYEDLFQAGSLGLTIAANHFNPNENVQFCTYAKYWIIDEVLKAISENRRIHLPKGVVANLKDFRKALEKLELELGRTPTVEELSECLSLPKEKVITLMDCNKSFTSLDIMVADDTSLSTFVASEEANSSEKRMQSETIKTLHKAIENVLNQKEQIVINKYFGIGDLEETSFQKIADELNMSREGARQIYLGAINKLRNSNYYNDLCLLSRE